MPAKQCCYITLGRRGAYVHTVDTQHIYIRIGPGRSMARAKERKASEEELSGLVDI